MLDSQPASVATEVPHYIDPRDRIDNIEQGSMLWCLIEITKRQEFTHAELTNVVRFLAQRAIFEVSYLLHQRLIDHDMISPVELAEMGLKVTGEALLPSSPLSASG